MYTLYILRRGHKQMKVKQQRVICNSFMSLTKPSFSTSLHRHHPACQRMDMSTYRPTVCLVQRVSERLPSAAIYSISQYFVYLAGV